MRNYGDIFTRKPATPTYPTQPAALGEVVEVLADGYVGAIVGHEKTYDGDFIRLENNQGKTRLFKLRRSLSMVSAPPSPNPNQQLGPNAPIPAPPGW